MEQKDHAVAVSEGVTNGNNIHFARVGSCQVTITQYDQICSLQLSPACLVDEAGITGEDAAVYDNREPKKQFFLGG